MKKTLIAILVIVLLALTSLSAFAAEASVIRPGGRGNHKSCGYEDCINGSWCRGVWCPDSGSVSSSLPGKTSPTVKSGGNKVAQNVQKRETAVCPNENCPNPEGCTGVCLNDGQRPQDGTGKRGNGSCGNSGSGVQSGKGMGRGKR